MINGKVKSEFVIPLFEDRVNHFATIIELVNFTICLIFDEEIFYENKLELFELLGFKPEIELVFDKGGVVNV